MVAPILPPSLVPFSWFKAEVPDDHEFYTLPVANGEPCFAIMLYIPPKRSTWRPRTVDAIPPLHVGKKKIFFACRVLANVLRDCHEFNQHTLLRLKPGKRVGMWAVPVSMVCNYDETAVVIGGAL